MKIAVLVVLCILLASCVVLQEVTWTKERSPAQNITTIVTPLAAEFCSALLGPNKVGCAVWMNNLSRCVIIVPPDSPAILEHEEKHCAGYNHE